MDDITEILSSSEDWLSSLSNNDLSTIKLLLQSGDSEEDVARFWLEITGPKSTAGFGGSGFMKSYFKNFKDEFDAFICDDTKYKSERKQAKAIWDKQGRNGLVAFIAGLIATKVGLAAVALLPPVALCLALLGKMGTTAYCNSEK